MRVEKGNIVGINTHTEKPGVGKLTEITEDNGAVIKISDGAQVLTDKSKLARVLPGFEKVMSSRIRETS